MTRSFHLFIALSLFAAFAAAGIASARADEKSEMVIKAVMIRKFVEFVKWPENVAPQKAMQVNVCVLGDSPMSQMNAVFDKTSATSPIKYNLRSIGGSGEAGGGACHVVFLGASKADAATLAGLKSLPVLTVSDAGGFADRGGMIGFEIIEGKIRYNINNRSFGTANLKIDAQLLEIANKVVE